MTRLLVIAIIGTCATALCERESPAARQAPSEVSYVLVRSDLPDGTQLAQTGHAAQEAVGHPPVVMVVLAVPDEETLKRYATAFQAAGIAHAAVVEDAGPFADH